MVHTEEINQISTEEYEIPPLQLIITAYEKQADGKYKAVVSHIFHADTEEEAYAILEAHIQTDSFFKASLTTGRLPWKSVQQPGLSGELILKSSDPKLLYP